MITLSSIFVSPHCVEAILIFIRHLARFHVPAGCPGWPSLEAHCSLLVPAFLDFAYYTELVFENCLRSLNFTIARSEFAARTALQFLQTASKRALNIYHVYVRAQIGKQLLVTWRSSSTHLTNFIEINETVFDHSYDFAVVTLASETILAVDWLAAFTLFRGQMAFLPIRTTKGFPFPHGWEHLCHRLWGSVSRRFACHCTAIPLASYSSILGVNSSVGYCFFQPALSFPRLELLICWDF